MKIRTAIIMALMVTLLTVPAWVQAYGEEMQKNYGGTLVTHDFGEPDFLVHNYDYTDWYVARLVLNRLLAYQIVPSFEIVPDVAERWEMSSDGLTYTFHLYRNIKFHDGHPCTSEDVKWTYETVLSEQGYWASHLSAIERIETPDDYTVVMILKEVNAAFLGAVANYYSPFILPKHLYEGTDLRNNPLNRKPIGTGPYKLQDWVEGSHITLVRNDDFFRGRPYLDTIVMRFSEVMSTALSGLESGEIHFLYNPPPYNELARLEKIPEIGIAFATKAVLYHLDFNLQRKPFNNLQVRQAIAAAVDNDEINQKVFAGYCIPAEGMWLKTITPWEYNPDARKPSYDPKMAEQLLDEAGYRRGSDGVRFKTTLISWTGMSMPTVDEVLKEQLRRVGIEVEIEPLEWGLLDDKVFTRRDFDLLMDAGVQGPELDDMTDYVGSEGYGNVMGYSSALVDELFVKGRSTVDPQERAKYYFELQQQLANDLPRFNLIEYRRSYAWRKEFQGFFFQLEYGQGIQDFSLERVWWTKAPAPATAVTTTTAAEATQTTTQTTAPAPMISQDILIAVIAAVLVLAGIGAYAWRRRRRG